MKICPKCNLEHEKSGLFCSRSCANSRNFTEEAKLKKSAALKGKPRGKRTNYNTEAQIAKSKETWLQKYLSTPFENLGPENRRRRVFEEQNFCCARCGISEWFGSKIPLELEHKDGNNRNNYRNNLEGLCPNCHSVTDTWRGRNKNKRSKKDFVTDEFLLSCLNESKNIHQGLLKAGLSAKGSNYKKAKKLLEKVTHPSSNG